MFKNIQSDLLAGIVVFLVALPLCLGIAHASGVPLISGLLSGIIGGIIIGILSQSSLSVSGPAAGLVVIILNALDTLGSVEVLMFAVFLAGIIQLLLGFLKAGIVGLYFPTSVIKGMLAAIGIILILKQIPHLVGFDTDAFGEEEFLLEDGSNTITYLIKTVDHISQPSMAVGVISLLVLIIWGHKAVVKRNPLRIIPGALMAVLVGTFLNLFMEFSWEWSVSPAHMVKLPVINLKDIDNLINLPDFTAWTNLSVYKTAVTIAIIASLETLLCIEAIDKIDPENRKTPQNTELKAQGIGNILCGLIGALPVTSVIVRSSTNLEVGAKTKISAIWHGILLLAAVLFFPGLINHIPLSTLAAVLIYVGFKLTHPAIIKRQYSLGFQQFIPFLITIVAIIFTDLLIGILIGLSIGFFYILKANHRVTYVYSDKLDKDSDNHVITIKLSEHVSFLNKANMQLTLEQLPENSDVLIDGTQSKDIDHDVLEIIAEFSNFAHQRNIRVTLKNIDLPEIHK